MHGEEGWFDPQCCRAFDPGSHRDKKLLAMARSKDLVGGRRLDPTLQTPEACIPDMFRIQGAVSLDSILDAVGELSAEDAKTVLTARDEEDRGLPPPLEAQHSRRRTQTPLGAAGQDAASRQLKEHLRLAQSARLSVYNNRPLATDNRPCGQLDGDTAASGTSPDAPVPTGMRQNSLGRVRTDERLRAAESKRVAPSFPPCDVDLLDPSHPQHRTPRRRSQLSAGTVALPHSCQTTREAQAQAQLHREGQLSRSVRRLDGGEAVVSVAMAAGKRLHLGIWPPCWRARPVLFGSHRCHGAVIWWPRFLSSLMGL